MGFAPPIYSYECAYDDPSLGVSVMDLLLKPNFLALHYVYFIVMSMIGSVIIYVTSTQIYDIQYVDALFMSVSAITGTGLSVVRTSSTLHEGLLTCWKLDLSAQSPVQQATLFILMFLGHTIPISGVVLVCRRINLRQIIRPSTEAKPTDGISSHTLAPESQTAQSSGEKCRSIPRKPADVVFCNRAVPPTFIEMKEDFPGCSSHPGDNSTSRHDVAIDWGLSFDSSHNEKVTRFNARPHEERKWYRKIPRFLTGRYRLMALKRCICKSFEPDIPRHLDEPGVLAAKATQLLSLIVLTYFVSIFLIGVITIAVWLRYDLPDVARAYNVAPSWAGAFLATSAFSNNGMSLIDANMVPFQKE